jgi:hypothetical protein
VIPLREVREFVLVEKDSVSDDDPVTRVAFSSVSMSSGGFRRRVVAILFRRSP